MSKNTCKCYECKKDIFCNDDEAMVCIECGGMNRRVNNLVNGVDDITLSKVFLTIFIFGFIFLIFK